MRGQSVRGQEKVAQARAPGPAGTGPGFVGATSGATDVDVALDDVRVPPPEISGLGRTRRERMLAAGREALECVRVLEKAECNLVGEVLRGCGTFYELEHYPPDDVFDRETHSQYYYHTHRGLPGEHGHFHTFLRRAGMPGGAQPVPYSGTESWPEGDEALSHLVAISMDAYGKPIGLFTANRWVTGDVWYPARWVERMLDRFAIDHAAPSWPTNRWITAMFQLFHPHIVALLERRDVTVAAWAAAHPGADVYEDRALEVTSWMPVSVEEEIERVRTSLNQTRRIR